MVETRFTSYADYAAEVSQGLGRKPKSLPSWLFYDERGGKLFQEIMRMPEYYVTRCEYEILHAYKQDLLDNFLTNSKSFQLIELGAGDGLKTEVLLKYFSAKKINFTYKPIDVSSSILSQLSERLQKKIPGIRVEPIQKKYSQALEELKGEQKQILFFLGANIGNFSIPQAETFMQSLSLNLSEHDMALIGFDLKKDPAIIERAYNDPQGITGDFNLNILTRLNRELDASFNIDNFSHYPFYDPETGAAKSFLVSQRHQEVFVGALKRSFRFNQWETILTEVSQKYDIMMIEKLVSDAGLEILDLFFDTEHFFCDVLIKKVAI